MFYISVTIQNNYKHRKQYVQKSYSSIINQYYVGLLATAVHVQSDMPDSIILYRIKLMFMFNDTMLFIQYIGINNIGYTG